MAGRPVGDIARDMVVAFGLSRALRMVRLHRQTRHFILAAWGGALAVTMTGMFPNYSPINVDATNTLTIIPMGARAAVVVSLVGARTRRLSGHEERTEYQQPQGHTVQTGGAPLFFSPCRKLLQRCGPGEMGTTTTTTMGLQASRATSPNRDLSLWAGHPEVCLRRVDLRRAQSAKMNYHPFRALLTKKIRDGTFPALSGRVNRHRFRAVRLPPSRRNIANRMRGRAHAV